MTVAQIQQFRVDLAIIGTSAIDADGALLDFDVHEVEISRAIIEHARRVVLVADSSKFSRSAPVKIANFSDIDIFVDAKDEKFYDLSNFMGAYRDLRDTFPGTDFAKLADLMAGRVRQHGVRRPVGRAHSRTVTPCSAR